MAELVARSAFGALLKPLGTGNGLVVSERANAGVAAIVGRQTPFLATRLAAIYGLALPAGPRRVATPAGELLGVSRYTWMAIGDGGVTFALRLGQEFAGIGDVVDQSGAYGLLDLSGPHVIDVLAKGLPIDLDPKVFAADAVAASQIARIGVIVWRTPGGFALLTPRSSAASFWHWLSASAAQYGLMLG